MTKKQKFNAIVERIKAEGWCTDPLYISVMMIVNYLTELQKLGVVECAYETTPIGRNVSAICEEFEWAPSDEDINQFVTEMIEKEYRNLFTHVIKQYRDNKEEFIKSIKDNSAEEE